MHLAAQGQAGSVLDEGVRDGGRDAGARQSRGVEAVGRVTGRPYASLMSMTTERGVTQRRWRRKWGVVVESNDEDGEEAIVIIWCYRPKHTDNPDAESGRLVTSQRRRLDKAILRCLYRGGRAGSSVRGRLQPGEEGRGANGWKGSGGRGKGREVLWNCSGSGSGVNLGGD